MTEVLPVVPKLGRPKMRSGIAFAAAMLSAGTARAQVIEIADDGSSRVYRGATTRVQTGEDAVDAVAVDPRVSATAPGDAPADAFVRAAAANRLDVGLLRAVAWTESRGRNDAVSAKGALGVMQLMPATAAALGVDPRDRDANIAGGAAYLARQLDRFGNVPLALAAYNAGPGAVIRWGGIPPYRETQGYVASVLGRWQGGVVTAGQVTPPAVQHAVVPPAVVLSGALGDGLLIEVSSL